MPMSIRDGILAKGARLSNRYWCSTPTTLEMSWPELLVTGGRSRRRLEAKQAIDGTVSSWVYFSRA